MREEHGRRSGRRRAAIAAVLVLVVAGGVGTWFATRGSSPANGATATTTTTLQTVQTGTISQSVSSTGTIEPANQANLDFAVSGTVTAVEVTTGQTVTAGQPLATIDGTALSASLALAQATLANDQSTLSTDQANGASSAQIASDQAAVASAQSQVTNAQRSVAQATLTSTIAGTVAAVNLAVGQQVTGSSSSSSSSSASGGNGSGGTGTGGSGNGSSGTGSAGSSSGSGGSGSGSNSSSSAQIVVVSTGSYIVNCTVNSTQVGQLQVGDQATATTSGSTSPLYGTVGSVGLLASSSSGVSSFPVVVDLTGTQTGLYGGTSVNVSIIVKQLQDVVVVPTAAISYSGGATSVTLDSNGHKLTQPVTIGISSAGQTQITGGLSVGQQIYVTQVSFRGGLGGSSGGSGLFGRSGAGGFAGGGGGQFGGGGGGGGGAVFVGPGGGGLGG